MKAYHSITRRVAVGYLVIVFFSTLAIGYALTRLHDHTRHTQQLVETQFHAFTLLRDIRQNLLAQENLEKQLLILEDTQLLDLVERRWDDFDLILAKSKRATLPDHFSTLPRTLANYRKNGKILLQAFMDKDWQQARKYSKAATLQRNQLLDRLSKIRNIHQIAVDHDLHSLSEQSNQAFTVTVLLAFAGLLLSAPVALTVILGIHRSVKALQDGTRDIAQGNFNSKLGIRSKDEFGQLALDFSSMARKLRELEQLHLDANPLTRLPGNLAIDRELERRIQDQEAFAHLYIDLDNFKAYGDRYGYKAGSDVIHDVGTMLKNVVKDHGTENDLVGHIGGDDYVVLTTPAKAETIAQALIKDFENYVPSLYNEEDRKAGYYMGTDRYGVQRSFPLLTMSIAVILSENMESPSVLAISDDCAKMKDHLKRLKGSNYLIDRRKHL
ncbi:diguanylate cyclase domain-containing protein [Desulfuromonas acetoxidans]|uniref:diguanylate cyclase n=1 Tax=Desulfuromonas acetoxidans (strain DSM 684 / 11070) TaxID=281689 RepID=Q1K1Q3_DESA6|nr:diguanylate cyclase [Desulfuromonas acetoxidans]EAT16335.1 diguanylate cyclase [Desulfuromonas acetoxidans DSM 684]MBF0645988.1 diguanylate cyclase [Desulfuromonas acetoxidans]NVD23474.1 diguanylate cyclase [Desulfuromonas acetoxidans]NVE16140.1 diguanylate cyclase [Desulfuromonas acetoxidans]